MMKLKYLFENFDLAREALKNWRHDEESLDETLSWYRISSNAVYPYKCDGQLCFLRLAPVEEKREVNLRDELDFICYLRSRGYFANAPIPASSGELLLKLETPWGAYYACAFERVSGTQLVKLQPTRDIILEYGRSLGRLHKLSESYTARTPAWSWREALEWVSQLLPEYAPSAKAAEELVKVRSLLEALPEREGFYGRVHYDFEADNVFFDDKSKSCSAIDFEDGMYHHFALDIEQTLDNLDEFVPPEQLDEAGEWFIEGYAQEHELGDMLEQLPLMRRFINLFGYARLSRSVSEQLMNEPEWMEGLRERINAFLDELERSFFDY